MAPYGYSSHTEASTADSCLSHLQRLRLPSPKSKHQIASALQNIPRTGAAVGCLSCKMAGRFSSITPTVAQRTDDGRSLAEQKVFGELQRSPRRMTACSNSTIWWQTRSPSGKAIRGNHRSLSDSCSVKSTGLKVPRVFSGLRYAIG